MNIWPAEAKKPHKKHRSIQKRLCVYVAVKESTIIFKPTFIVYVLGFISSSSWSRGLVAAFDCCTPWTYFSINVFHYYMVHMIHFLSEVCLIFGFTSQSTTLVMSRRSVDLTTLFLGRLPKRLTSTKCTSFCH